MARSKERSEVEQLRGEVRSLKSEIRHLKKELARAQKRQHQLEDIEQREQDLELEEKATEYVAPTKAKCPECGGNLQETNIGVRTLITCSGCNYRQSKKV